MGLVTEASHFLHHAALNVNLKLIWNQIRPHRLICFVTLWYVSEPCLNLVV